MRAATIADEKLDREPLVRPDDADHDIALARAEKSVNRARRLAFLFAALVPLTCFLVWCSHHSGRQGGAVVAGNEDLEDASGRYGTCEVAKSRTVIAPHKNVWRNLDIEEAKEIRSWLFDKQQGMNLTSNVLAGPQDNTVFIIEAYRVKKKEALVYLDQNGPEPQRYAHTIINHPSHSATIPYAHIRDYVIGPLPIQAGTTIRPLEDGEGYTNSIIPWNGRLMGFSDMPLIAKYLQQTFHPLAELTMDLFGVRADGYANDTMMMGGQAPSSFDGTWRRFWMPLKMVSSGLWLHPLDCQLYVDMSGQTEADWKILKVYYNSQIFHSLEDFVAAWKDGSLKRSKKPIAPKDDSDWSTRSRKGKKRDLDNIAGPRSVSFDGARFRYDEKEKYVTYMGWAFYMGFERDMGLNFWDISFRGERIIYELTPQEALAQYSGMDPAQSTTVWLDRAFGMGALSRELMVGYDCPANALYLPTTVHTTMGTIVQQNAICIFEQDVGRPLSRHWGNMDKDEMGAIKGYQLTVRSIATIGNYDYIFEYSFQLDGTMEIRFSASGYLQGGFWDGNPERMAYGTPIRETTMGALHDHVINYKVDMDIAGTKNSLKAITLENVKQHLDWYDEDWGTSEYQQQIVHRPIKTENDSRLDYGTNSGGMYVIQNDEATNAWGVPRGYAIHPGASNIHLTNLNAKRTLHNAEWAKHSLHVTQSKDTEPYSSHFLNINLPGKPPVDFGTFLDGESLEQEDLTLWLNLGTHHLPRSEDSPHTLTNVATSYLLLIPHNFNDYDVSMEAQNAVLINMGAPGQSWQASGDIEESMCIPKRPEAFSYSGVVDMYGEEGLQQLSTDIVHEAESIHALRAGL